LRGVPAGLPAVTFTAVNDPPAYSVVADAASASTAPLVEGSKAVAVPLPDASKAARFARGLAPLTVANNPPA
jgi:flavin reductase (DIM6/NTAB) family NADH-FMN oxidoreductase RutF